MNQRIGVLLLLAVLAAVGTSIVLTAARQRSAITPDGTTADATRGRGLPHTASSVTASRAFEAQSMSVQVATNAADAARSAQPHSHGSSFGHSLEGDGTQSRTGIDSSVVGRVLAMDEPLRTAMQRCRQRQLCDVIHEHQPAFEAEARDEAWASNMEEMLFAHFSRTPFEPKARILDIECRTTLCAVQLSSTQAVRVELNRDLKLRRTPALLAQLDYRVMLFSDVYVDSEGTQAVDRIAFYRRRMR